MAHKGDIGGPVPGSCSAAATEIFNEGLHLPAVRYQRDYQTIRDLERIIAANSRSPEVVVGDMRGSARLGTARRTAHHAIAGKHGIDELRAYFAELLRVSEARVRSAVGSVAGRDVLGRTIRRRRWHRPRAFLPPARHGAQDGRPSAASTSPKATTRPGAPANIRPPLLRAACAYVVISLLGKDTWVNSGLLDALDISHPPG